MSLRHVVMLTMLLVLSLFFSGPLAAQVVSGPQPQLATLNGFATDGDAAAVPGATIVIDGPDATDHRAVRADDTGYFLVLGLQPARPYHLTASAPGFASYTSPEFTLTAGQVLTLSDVKMQVGEVGTSITVLPTDVIAEQQVNAEIQQKVLGIIPNFYVVYGGAEVAPLSTALKFKLAYKASLSPVNLLAAAFVGGINQGLDTPNYVQGAKGYGQRVGATFATGITDVYIGGAVLPSLLHQDPRYFFQGTGTKKSRAVHALLSPLICRGDNGRAEINFSSIGGDLSSASIAEIYYPPSSRGAGTVFEDAAVVSVGRIANAFLQEFVLSRFTSGPHPKP